MWARSLDAVSADSRYLYLRGATRTGLPPYGFSWVTRQTPRPRHVVLVEGLLDVHHLRSRGVTNVVALGGTGTRAALFERLAHLGFERVTLCLDRDAAGRAATSRAVENAARAPASPPIYVVDSERLAPGKDPDDFVRQNGADAWGELSRDGVCGVTWRALEFVAAIEPKSSTGERREGLARAGAWLGTLPPRLALEQEDALRLVAERCGYSIPAVERTFRARFWREPSRSASPEVARGL
jgi:DNA primase